LTGPAHSRRTDGNVAASARAELARLRRGLDRLEAALDRLEIPPASQAARSRPGRYYELLVDVYEHGRHGAAAGSFADLGRARGYDARGLGGFFVGALAPLTRENDRVRLTAEGHRLVRDYLTGPGA
jgi:hypothetical protein